MQWIIKFPGFLIRTGLFINQQRDAPQEWGILIFLVGNLLSHSFQVMFFFFCWLLYGFWNFSRIQDPAMIHTAATARATIEPIYDFKDTFPVVPVLCYHQVRPWKVSDSRSTKTLVTPPQVFAQHMQLLNKSDYTSILPADLVRAAKENHFLPAKPVLITFDDGSRLQFVNAVPVLNALGFKAVFFIMTTTLHSPNYLSAGELREMVKQGHVVAAHTFDHRSVSLYSGNDWIRELETPKATLEKITGHPVKYFAYPYGAWTSKSILRLQQTGYEAAFQLLGKTDSAYPLFTVRRLMVNGNWTATQLLREMQRAFH